MSQATAVRHRDSEHRRPFPPRRRTLVAAAGVLVLAFAAMAPTASYARPVPGSFADMAAKVTPAVVNISAERDQQMAQNPSRRNGQRMMPFPEGSPFGEFFRRFREYGPQMGPQQYGERGPKMQRPRKRKLKALGSGFIIDPDGYVVTNNHVVKGASKIEVILHDGSRFTAKVVGTDPRTDLALLKIKADHKFPYVQWGDSDKARVGDWILAVGNPYGLGGTVTAGIVSARGRNIGGRTIVDFLQIDAPINRGNSGGPTFNMDGKVVGVNTAIYSPNGGNIGLGFAIPSNLAKSVIGQLRDHGKISRGWLGVQVQPVTDDIAKAMKLKDRKGAMVAAVLPNSPAAKAGLKSGDLILSWDGKAVESMRDLVRKVSATKAGANVDVVLLRDGDRKTLPVTVGQYKAENRQASANRNKPNQPAAAVGKLGLGVGNLTPEVRSRLGIDDQSIKGAVVLSVKPDSVAADKGLRPGDLITRVGDTDVVNAEQVATAVAKAIKDRREAVLFKVTRNGNARYLGLPLKS